MFGTSRKADGTKNDWGNLIFAIDPELLVNSLADFQAGVSDLIARLKDRKTLPTVDEILVPGERGDAFYEATMAVGEIEINDNLWRDLQVVAESGVS